jgi:Kef-type K+ transport system membrane component KefB/CBS domain-containing protein
MESSNIILILGLLLLVAFFSGRLAVLLRLPRVTAYLLVGTIFGPSILNIVSEEHADLLRPLMKLAMALVLFNLGCQFPINRARRILRHVVKLSLAELTATLLLVTSGLWLLGQSWEAALLLGTLALATAPATTILVLKETESEGTITDYAQAMVAINNLVAILAFELVFLAIEFIHQEMRITVTGKLAGLLRDLTGSLLLGICAGLVVSYFFGLIAQKHRLVLLVAITVLLLGLCETLHTPYLLAFLAMGITTANTCFYTARILDELDRLTGLLCVVFFVVSGVELDIGALLAAGIAGAAYIVLRFAGKYLGVALAAKRQRERRVVRYWLGTTLISQAGAAIALAAIVTERMPELGRHVQLIILGTVPFFEIAGPILIRRAVLEAGEVTLAYAIPHAGADLLEQLRTVWNRVLLAFGFDPWHGRTETELTVQQIMRKNIHPIVDSLNFEELLAFIEHSRDNTYPVVNDKQELVGMIRYRELSEALVDRSLGPLVRAEDVTTPAVKKLYPDDPVSRAIQAFKSIKDDCLPVVMRGEPDQLLGIVRRRDLLRMLIRHQSSSNG